MTSGAGSMAEIWVQASWLLSKCPDGIKGHPSKRLGRRSMLMREFVKAKGLTWKRSAGGHRGNTNSNTSNSNLEIQIRSTIQFEIFAYLKSFSWDSSSHFLDRSPIYVHASQAMTQVCLLSVAARVSRPWSDITPNIDGCRSQIPLYINKIKNQTPIECSNPSSKFINQFQSDQFYPNTTNQLLKCLNPKPLRTTPRPHPTHHAVPPTQIPQHSKHTHLLQTQNQNSFIPTNVLPSATLRNHRHADNH